MKHDNVSQLAPPSKTLTRFASELAQLRHYPALDAGCGTGRNAIALALLGLPVVCVDRDINRLRLLKDNVRQRVDRTTLPGSTAGQLFPVCADLDQSTWPFSTNQFSVIICVEFLKIELLKYFWSALVVGGYLFIETFGGHGQNHLDLPKAEQLRDLLSDRFNISFYQERKVGPFGYDAVSVKLLAQKR
jgi:SAM-dependent methyltransferase